MKNRLVILKRWIQGDTLDPLPNRLLPVAGGLLATLHNLPLSLPDLPTRTRRLSLEHHSRIAEFEDKTFAVWLADKFKIVYAHEACHHRAMAICHGDLFADNLIHRPDGSLAVIDWETVSLDDPLLDLGMAAVGLARHQTELPSRRLQLLIEGYTQIRPLPTEDLESLPIEIMHAALIIAFHRYYRHNIRFPNSLKANLHEEIVTFVDSLPVAKGA
jgi:homoserine kinase type II